MHITFTGTGTFIVRLLQSGLITPADLQRKYQHELHANEILLLAYYIAAVNIEAAYHQITLDSEAGSEYEPFEGIVLTDTFQLTEGGDQAFPQLLAANSERLERQRKLDIRVIIGNPPYSVGQTSENDANQNEVYPALDARIGETYAAGVSGLRKSLYDSYVRAIRWASDRIGDEGVIAYVSNGGYIDSASAAGLRKCLTDEFSDIYCYNLRGNQRTAGELSRKEGGKIFGSGSRSTVAILILVKTPGKNGTSTVHYQDIGDYLTREQKFGIISRNDLDTIAWQNITPNSHGDWINQRNDVFEEFPPIGYNQRKGDPPQSPIFESYSYGLVTNRDAWTYNFSTQRLEDAVARLTDTYNTELSRAISSPGAALENDPTRISWTRSLKKQLALEKPLSRESGSVVESAYRPFCKQRLYFDPRLNEMVNRIPEYFGPGVPPNYGILLTAPSSHFDFGVIATDRLPNMHLLDTGQFFPRWAYQPIISTEEGQGELLARPNASTAEIDGYRRHDNIADAALNDFRATFGAEVTKDDIYFYTYGLLHSQQYRREFAADLKKMLPRIPKVASFREFRDAGRSLTDLHIGYEVVEPYPLSVHISAAPDLSDSELYRVNKMVIDKKDLDRSRIVYNPYIVIDGIPSDAYRYMLGPRAAIEWIVDRYQVKTDKASGIVNDPNDWSAELGNPRYILDLLARVVTVSIETMKIVDALPDLDIID